MKKTSFDEKHLFYQSKSFKKLDRVHTFANRWKLFLLTKAFNKWKEVLIKPEIITPQKPKSSNNNNNNNNNTQEEMKEEPKDTPQKTKARKKINTFKIRHCGLRNLGNTCFMNSILQALVTIPSLQEYFTQTFLPPPKKQDEVVSITMNEQTFFRRDTMFCFNNLAERHRKAPELNEISVCNQLHELFRVLWSGKWSVVTPFSLLESVWKFFPSFKNRQQQDAQEFLIHLLDRIHTEIAGPHQIGKPDTRFSIITQVFQGKLSSQIKCLRCQRVCSSTEAFTDLQLTPPNISLAKYRGKEVATNTLEECFDNFTAPTALGEKARDCDYCKSKEDAETRFLLSSLPQNLIILIKRFYWTATSRAKINSKIAFPLEIDLKPWTEKQNSEKFSLQSVIVHHGLSPTSGHYTCYSKINDEWVYFNDARTKIASVEEVLKAEASLLFYQKIENPFL